jgi:hypothetical protein
MKKNEVQPKMDMTPIWEKKGEFVYLLLTPFLFLGFCVVLTTLMAWMIGAFRWLSETLSLFLPNLLQ